MHEDVPCTTVVPAQQPRALRPPISPPATHCPPGNFLPQPAPLMHPTTQTVPLQNPYNYPMNPINFFAAKPISNQHYLNDHCYLSYPYYCQPYKNYKNNPKKRGKPPHDPQCPKRMGFNYSQHLYFKYIIVALSSFLSINMYFSSLICLEHAIFFVLRDIPL